MTHTQLATLAFGAIFAVLHTAHWLADHGIQTSHQSETKGTPGWPGRIACAAHVATYTLTTAGFVLLVWAVFGLQVSLLGFLTGQAISAATHYWIDRRFTLARLCDRLGKTDFYRLGAPRPGHDDNPSLGTGAYALDQTAHRVCLFVAALATVLL